MAISEALTNLETLEDCGKRARALAEEKYSIAAQGMAYKSLFESVIENTRTSRQ